MTSNGVKQILRCRPFNQKRGRAHAQWKHQKRPDAEREAEGWAAADHIVAIHSQQSDADDVSHDENVAVKVYRGFGLAGRSGRKGQQCDVFAGGVAPLESSRMRHHPLLKIAIAIGNNLARTTCHFARALELIHCTVIAESVIDLSLIEDLRKLPTAQQGHCRDCDPSDLQHG